jgi:hypothetical protein
MSQKHHPHRGTTPRHFAIGLRPRSWQRWAAYITTGMLLASGATWLVAHYLLHGSGEFGAELPSPLEPLALRLHGIAAYLFVFVFGSMSTAHIVLGWRLRRNRRTGTLLVGACALLAVTALLLYYAAEDWHPAASLVHWICGLLLAPLLWAHVLAARAGRHEIFSAPSAK